MPLRLQACGAEEKPVLDNLMQLYLHEMCKYNPIPIGEDGRFRYEYLDQYFGEPGRFPLLVRVMGKIAGFVLVRTVDNIAQSPTFSIAEFFILENYRRLGIGEEVARMVLDEFPGHWQIGVLGPNQPARDFWRQTLYRYTANQFRTTTVDGWEGPVYVFKSPGPRPKEPAAQTAPEQNLYGQPERS